MNKFEKIFGSGPIGLLISLALLAIFLFIEKYFSSFQITENDFLRYSIFSVLSVLTVIIIIWSVKSLPPSDRGNKLITLGAFKYFRHPLYAAFLTFFNFGLAILLNNWIYILWALVQHPVWHWCIGGEEKLMEKEFPGEYTNYSKRTGRFFPRIFNKSDKAT
ncbi:MAG: isoprenylcysteine carboxylmethyltransferase family protein [Ignavibacteriales bacterium]|nr:MAG: isoprenylcysteine carboxylmethyltransferase family protein [Ignavibacteriales bacterium]